MASRLVALAWLSALAVAAVALSGAPAARAASVHALSAASPAEPAAESLLEVGVAAARRLNRAQGRLQAEPDSVDLSQNSSANSTVVTPVVPQVQKPAAPAPSDGSNRDLDATVPAASVAQVANGTELAAQIAAAAAAEQARRDKGLCPDDCTFNGLCFNGTCACYTGWAGDRCDTRVCPFNCSERGDCVDGICQCHQGWYGDSCSVKGCPYNCNRNGYCHDSMCLCFAEYEGLYCQDELGCPNRCNSPHGECVLPPLEARTRPGKKCMCHDGWTGDDCTERECPGGCTGMGACNSTSGVCTCVEGRFGADCSKRFCPQNCSGHGVCDHSDGTCKCEEGYFGHNCAPENCHANCTAHGSCHFDNTTSKSSCDCDRGWAGVGCDIEMCPLMCGESDKRGECTVDGCRCVAEWGNADCGRRRCPFDCNGNGLCDDKYSCDCLAGWTGKSCDTRTCPLDCNFRGACRNGTCECTDWWTGQACELPTCKNNCSGNGECVKPLLPPMTPAAELDKALQDSASPAEKLQATLAGMPKQGVSRAQCRCADGFGGTDCSFRLCPNDCSSNGVCHNGVCWCEKGYYGDDCSQAELVTLAGDNSTARQLSPRESCERTCVHGKCFISRAAAGTPASDPFAELKDAAAVDPASAPYQCHCTGGWSGANCDVSLTVCSPLCRDANGLCRPGCVEPSHDSCPTNRPGTACSGHGSCLPNADGEGFHCLCEKGFVGDACSPPGCPNDCSGHGMCNSNNHQCICYGGFTGDDCSRSI